MRLAGNICIAISAVVLLALPVSAKKHKPAERTGLSTTDMVLIYSGATQSSYWDADHVKDYVSYTDRDGEPHWLFDGFLLLEIRDIGEGSSEVAFDPGHKNKDGSILQAAARSDWLRLVQYYFSDGHAIDAIEKSVEEAARILGPPPGRRQVMISIPNPIEYKNPVAKTGGTTYWGVIGDRVMDFSDDRDRILACKWYIDQVLAHYGKKQYEHVELAGFYWVTEESPENGPLVSAVSSYLADKGYGLCWIPYFHAPGYGAWKEKGFDSAYYQPNYFFNDNVPYERLNIACKEAAAYGMDMEMEFDESALAKHGRGYRLRDYMTVFREEGPWAGCRIAYYQSGAALRALKYSDDPEDNELYYDFCDFVVNRPYRNIQGQ